MRYLLDTHTAFWYFEGSSELSAKAKAAIAEGMTFLTADANVPKYDVKWSW